MPERGLERRARGLRALALIFGTAFRSDWRRATAVFVLVPATGLTTALLGLWLKLLADAASDGDLAPALAAGGAIAASLTLQHVCLVALAKLRFSLQERTTVMLERRLVELAASLPGIAHHELPEYRDKLEYLRTQRGRLGQAVGGLVTHAAILAQAVATVVLLATVHPALLLLPLVGVPSLVLTAWAARLLDRSREATAPHSRLARDLVSLSTSPGAPSKELRLFGLRDEVLRRHGEASEALRRARVRACARGARWQCLGSLLFLLGYLGAIAFVARRAQLGQSSPGDVLLTVMLAGQVTGAVGGVVSLVGWLQDLLQLAGRYLWFVDRGAAAGQWAGRSAPPERLRHGICLERVAFRYPGCAEEVLQGVDLEFPAGSVVALVGENGSGKSTIVKLLCGFYEPSGGRVTVDGVDLRDLDPVAWRRRLAGAFQDFYRFHTSAQEAIGVGDLDRLEDACRVGAALSEAGGTDVLQALPDGLGTQLGRTFDGVELSEGQWQKLALARARMRERPLLLLLDEPTASLDAATEHAQFARMAGAARRTREDGGVVVIVSHRFSTVHMADLVAVIDAGRVVEIGPPAELLTGGGLYAELFELQARAYR